MDKLHDQLAEALEEAVDRFEAALEATHATRTDRRYIKEWRKVLDAYRAAKGPSNG